MSLPKIVADTPLAEAVEELMAGKVEILPWSLIGQPESRDAVGLYTFGHLLIDGELMDKLPKLKVISNYGVGVDHIHLPAAAQRNIPVGNTPGVRDGATADIVIAQTGPQSIEIVAAGRRYAVEMGMALPNTAMPS